MQYLIFMLIMSSIAGCSTPQPRINPPLMRCPESLPLLKDGTAGEVAGTMAIWAAQYHECRILHDGLVDALTQ